MTLRNFLSWCYKNTNSKREMNIRERMMKIHEMDSVISPVPPVFEMEFVATKPYTFSRVETISVRPKPLGYLA